MSATCRLCRALNERYRAPTTSSWRSSKATRTPGRSPLLAGCATTRRRGAQRHARGQRWTKFCLLPDAAKKIHDQGRAVRAQASPWSSSRPQASLDVTAPIRALGDWLQVRQRPPRCRRSRTFSVRTESDHADLHLDYFGTPGASFNRRWRSRLAAQQGSGSVATSRRGDAPFDHTGTVTQAPPTRWRFLIGAAGCLFMGGAVAAERHPAAVCRRRGGRLLPRSGGRPPAAPWLSRTLACDGDDRRGSDRDRRGDRHRAAADRPRSRRWAIKAPEYVAQAGMRLLPMIEPVRPGSACRRSASRSCRPRPRNGGQGLALSSAASRGRVAQRGVAVINLLALGLFLTPVVTFYSAARLVEGAGGDRRRLCRRPRPNGAQARPSRVQCRGRGLCVRGQALVCLCLGQFSMAPWPDAGRPRVRLRHRADDGAGSPSSPSSAG